MSDDPRAIVAAEHGLDSKAAAFLTGSTVAELEASAIAFANLIGEQRDDRRVQTPSDLFASAAAAKAARQRLVLDAVTGRAPQPRDEQGCFASTGFDGGAREPAPTPGPTHDEWLVRVIRERRADVGARF